MRLIHRVADVLLTVLAAVWMARPVLLEVAGGALLVAAGWRVSESLGLTIGGLWLSLQAYGIRRERRAP